MRIVMMGALGLVAVAGAVVAVVNAVGAVVNAIEQASRELP